MFLSSLDDLRMCRGLPENTEKGKNAQAWFNELILKIFILNI